jgi:long-chain acyl-CoA synthetase
MLRERGVRPGDRVVLKLANTPAYVAAFLGTLHAGAIAVPLDARLRPRELHFHLADCEARLLIAAPDDGCAAGVETLSLGAAAPDGRAGAAAAFDATERAAGDTALLLYSSGTTGTPKAVELTHGNLAAASAMTAAALRAVLQDAVVLVAAPLCHGYGLGVGLDAPLRTGATIALLERFDADAALDLVERERPAAFLGVPTMFVRMIAAQAQRPRDLGSLRACLSGGGALRPALLHDCERALGCEVLEGYGASEVLRIATNRPGRRIAGSVGRPLDGVRVRVVDAAGAAVAAGGVGEVEVRAPSVMKGYWRDPAATAAVIRGGWLRTGDLGRIDGGGALFLAGRSKDIIIRGGFNVQPAEIEAVLALHPDVAEAAVVGIPDDEMGEEIAAAVVLVPGCDEPDPVARIAGWLREQVAPHKRPRLLWTVDALPRGITGKVLRAELRAAAAGRRATHAPAATNVISDSTVSPSVAAVSSRSTAMRTLR